jgi:hypothetical protein
MKDVRTVSEFFKDLVTLTSVSFEENSAGWKVEIWSGDSVVACESGKPGEGDPLGILSQARDFFRSFSVIPGTTADVPPAVPPPSTRRRGRRPGRRPSSNTPPSSRGPLKEKRARRANKLDAFRDIIGKLPDLEVAKKARCSHTLVYLYRKRHGIPGVRKTKESSESTASRRRERPTKEKPSEKAAPAPEKKSIRDHQELIDERHTCPECKQWTAEIRECLSCGRKLCREKCFGTRGVARECGDCQKAA